jgi:hypothetical protein
MTTLHEKIEQSTDQEHPYSQFLKLSQDARKILLNDAEVYIKALTEEQKNYLRPILAESYYKKKLAFDGPEEDRLKALQDVYDEIHEKAFPEVSYNESCSRFRYLVGSL